MTQIKRVPESGDIVRVLGKEFQVLDVERAQPDDEELTYVLGDPETGEYERLYRQHDSSYPTIVSDGYWEWDCEHHGSPENDDYVLEADECPNCGDVPGFLNVMFGAQGQMARISADDIPENGLVFDDGPWVNRGLQYARCGNCDTIIYDDGFEDTVVPEEVAEVVLETVKMEWENASDFCSDSEERHENGYYTDDEYSAAVEWVEEHRESEQFKHDVTSRDRNDE